MARRYHSSKQLKHSKAKNGASLKHSFYTACLILAGLATLGTFGYFNYTETSNNEKIDHNTFCLKEIEQDLNVVLVDHTDKINTIQNAAIETRLWDLVRAAPKNSHIQVFSVDRLNDKLLTPELDICNPGDDKSVDNFTGNKNLAKKRYEAIFREPMSQILGRVLQKDTAHTSPVMEAIQSVAVSSFLGDEKLETKKTLVIVSDLLQHTDGFSIYRGLPSFDAFIKTAYWRSIKSNLSGVNVEIFFLHRNGTESLQTIELREFWIHYLEAQGATVTRFTPIEG